MPAHEFWQPDPTGRHERRWRRRDGTWGDQVSDGGVIGTDPYDEPQPSPDRPDLLAPGSLPADASPPAAQPVVPVTVQMPATDREPLGFWQTTLAVAVGVLIAAAVGLVALSALAEQALEGL